MSRPVRALPAVRLGLLVVVSLAGLWPLGTGRAPAVAVAQEALPVEAPLEDRYIVTLRADVAAPEVVALELAEGANRRLGLGAAAAEAAADRIAERGGELLPADEADAVEVSHVYASALKGFAARIPAGALARVMADPRVVSVEPDRPVALQAQTLPTGVNRVEADRNPTARIDGVDQRVDADVAVLDTGVDAAHPDLNVVGGTNCTPNGNWAADGNGHGTVVAGILGAKDNGFGVVGVAPGVRIWSAKVLDPVGGGSISYVLCGIDWVTTRGGTIDVVNFSIGLGESFQSTCANSSVHAAVCRAVNAGVTWAVAAGNGASDARWVAPAAYDEVITVSALEDYNGTPSGDRLAWFSNYGADVDLAAPGVEIYSTVPGGGYGSTNPEGVGGRNSGTSFSTPHVAGAAALYIAANGRVGPAAVRNALRAAREPVALAGDPDGIAEGILNVGRLPGGRPAVRLSPAAGGVGGQVGVALSGFPANRTVYVRFDNAIQRTVTTGAAGTASTSFAVPAAKMGAHTVKAADGIGSTPSTASATATFTVAPRLALSPTAGPVGTAVGATLTGYPANRTVHVRWDNAIQRTVTTDAAGGARAGFPVPAGSAAGAHAVKAADGYGSTPSTASATAGFTVRAASLAISPRSGAAGSIATVTLGGFAPNEAVRVLWDTGRTLRTVTVGSTGGATASVGVPSNGTPGEHRIVATGAGGASAGTTFTVTGALAAADALTPTAPTGTATPPGTPVPVTEPPLPPTESPVPPTESPVLPTETPVPPTPTPTPTPYPAVGGGQVEGASPAALVTDGDPGTVWAAPVPAPPETAHVYVDLGSPVPIGRVRWLFGVAGLAEAVTVEVSADGVGWAPLGTFAAGPAGEWQETATAVGGRFVRFSLVAPVGAAQVGGLAEVEVWA